MINLSSSESFAYFSKTLPLRLTKEKVILYTYMILDPATRKDLSKALFMHFEEMEGIFPIEISDLLTGKNEEPQLILLTEKTQDLLEIVLREDINTVQIIYTPLKLQALATQLRPQIYIKVEENNQDAFLRYWDGRVFPTLSTRLNTRERKEAFFGNIYAIITFDEEFPELIRLFYMAENEEVIENRIEDFSTEVLIDTLDIEYNSFKMPMEYSSKDKEAFQRRTFEKQLRQMSRRLSKELEYFFGKTLTYQDLYEKVTTINSTAYQKYGLYSTEAIYTFIKSSYILGYGFEKGHALENTLLDTMETNSVKKNEIELYYQAQIIKHKDMG